jgi:predicted DsbA family dithiol-disulfide isomerase
LTECKNIADFEVLLECAKDVGLDIETWQRAYYDKETLNLVYSDLNKAMEYGINGVPTLVANEKYGIVGAYKYEILKKWIENVIKKEGK